MWPNPKIPTDLLTFTEEILYGKPHFLKNICEGIIFGKISIVDDWPSPKETTEVLVNHRSARSRASLMK